MTDQDQNADQELDDALSHLGMFFFQLVLGSFIIIGMGIWALINREQKNTPRYETLGGEIVGGNKRPSLKLNLDQAFHINLTTWLIALVTLITWGATFAFLYREYGPVKVLYGSGPNLEGAIILGVIATIASFWTRKKLKQLQEFNS